MAKSLPTLTSMDPRFSPESRTSKSPSTEESTQSLTTPTSQQMPSLRTHLTAQDTLPTCTRCSPMLFTKALLSLTKFPSTSSPMALSKDTEVNVSEAGALVWTEPSGPFLALLTVTAQTAPTTPPITTSSSSGTHSKPNGTKSKERLESRSQPTTKSLLQS